MSRKHKKLPRTKAVIYFRGDEVDKIVGELNWTQASKAAHELYRGYVQHTRRYKLRRFLRRLRNRIAAALDSALTFHDEIRANDIRPIGLIEERNTYERVFELGADK